jgi:hypothetical protein
MNPIDTSVEPPKGGNCAPVFALDDVAVRRDRRRRESDRMKAPSSRTWDGQATQRREPISTRETINLRDC